MLKKHHNKKPVGLPDILSDVLKSRGWDTIVREQRVLGVWDDAVGVHIAQHSIAKQMTRGVLFVLVRNSVWLQELSLRKAEIIERLNLRLCEPMVQDIRFAQGEIPQKNIAASPPKEIPAYETSRDITGYTEGIKDKQLEEIINRTLLKAFSRREMK